MAKPAACLPGTYLRCVLWVLGAAELVDLRGGPKRFSGEGDREGCEGCGFFEAEDTPGWSRGDDEDLFKLGVFSNF